SGDSWAVNLGSITTTAQGNPWDQGAHGMVASGYSGAFNAGSIETEGLHAYGMMALDNSSIFNLSSGSIHTIGYYSNGMVASGDSLAFNSGSINTEANWSTGMSAEYSSIALNLGQIFTEGEMSTGMLGYDHSFIANSGPGTIETSGYTSDGMIVDNYSVALNMGSIITHKATSHGMSAYNYSVALNPGGIFTIGQNATGMFAEYHSTAVNTGNVVTGDDPGYFAGEMANGITAQRYSRAVNTGNIETYGMSASGIYANNHSRGMNYGSIETHGEGSCGMFAMNVSSADNYGTIVTSGDAAHGMKAGDNAIARNFLDITTHGDGSYGMYALDASSADNYGMVVTSGAGSHAMVISGDSWGYNEGLLEASGAGSDAARVISSDFVNAGWLDSLGGNAVTAMDNSHVTMLDGSVLVNSHTLAGDDTSQLLVSMDIPTQAEPFSAQVQGFELFTKRGAGWMTLEEDSYVYGHTSNEGGTLEIWPLSQFVTDSYYQSAGAMLYVYMNPDSYLDLDEIPLWVENDADISGILTIDGTTATLPGFYTFIRADTYTDNFETQFVNVSPYYLPYGPVWLEGGSWHNTSLLGYSFSEAALGLVAAVDDWNMLRWIMGNHLQEVAESMKEMEVGEKKIHAHVLGGSTTRDPSTEYSAGYDSTQKGLSVGFDKKHSENTVWGLYAGYTEKDIDITQVPMALSDWEKQDTWHFGVYMSKRWDKWILSDTLTYRTTDHDTFRAQVGGDATASFSSWSVTNDLRFGYVAKDFGAGSNWQVIPEVGLNVGYFDRGGYTEENGFSYGDFDTTVVQSVLGVRFRGEYERADGSTFVPELRLAWVHVLSGGDITIDQSWGDTTHWFTETLDDDYFVADLGLTLYKLNNMDISLNYSGRFSDNSTTHGGWLRLEWKF
ncbi:MAG: autotransporter outer membrane beta-barrel domain-containing protein, partial [Thermovirgaceae bacterium]